MTLLRKPDPKSVFLSPRVSIVRLHVSHPRMASKNFNMELLEHMFVVKPNLDPNRTLEEVLDAEEQDLLGWIKQSCQGLWRLDLKRTDTFGTGSLGDFYLYEWRVLLETRQDAALYRLARC